VRNAARRGADADQARAHGLPESEVLEEVILERQAVKRLLEPTEVADVARSSSALAAAASPARLWLVDQGFGRRR
jgi:3-hydroxybutyrate dehydrogenase